MIRNQCSSIAACLFLIPTLLRGNAYRTKIMGRSCYKFTIANLPHFITCTASSPEAPDRRVLQWIPIFTCLETVTIVLDSLRFLTQDGMKLYAYVILENHLHLIAQSEQLGRDIARFKSYTAKNLIRYLDKNKVKTILEQLAYAFPRRSVGTRKNV